MFILRTSIHAIDALSGLMIENFLSVWVIIWGRGRGRGTDREQNLVEFSVLGVPLF